MLYWWPRVKDLDIPVPETKIIKVSHGDMRSMVDPGIPGYPYEILETIKREAKDMLPVFIRTDQASDKHGYQGSCVAYTESEISSCVAGTIEFNLMADMIGLPFKAIVVRELLRLEAPFKAFHGGLPIAKERRYFISDGEVREWFPYWQHSAIEQTSFHPQRSDWRQALIRINYQSPWEVETLISYAEKVAQTIDGYWSVDFACTKDDEWYLIDVAPGELSWKPTDQDKGDKEPAADLLDLGQSS